MKKKLVYFPNCKKIANENYKGQSVGSSNIDPNKPKAQYMKTYENPRVHETDTTVIKQEATNFLKKHEKIIDTIVTNSNVNNKPALLRINKHSQLLYHENVNPYMI